MQSNKLENLTNVYRGQIEWNRWYYIKVPTPYAALPRGCPIHQANAIQDQTVFCIALKGLNDKELVRITFDTTVSKYVISHEYAPLMDKYWGFVITNNNPIINGYMELLNHNGTNTIEIATDQHLGKEFYGNFGSYGSICQLSAT